MKCDMYKTVKNLNLKHLLLTEIFKITRKDTNRLNEKCGTFKVN